MNSSHLVLLIDPNARRREILAGFLRNLQVKVESAAAVPRPSVWKQHEAKSSLILAVRWETGSLDVEPLREIKKSRSRVSIIILSPDPGPSELLSLLQEGTVSLVAQPENLVSIYSSIKNEISRNDLVLENEYYRKNLIGLKTEQTRNIRRAVELEQIYDATLENLMTALDLRDVETFGHSQTVAKYSQALAGILGVTDKNTLDNIRKGALLHDIGKIAIPDSILKKPGGLTAEEWEKIKLHPSLGFGLIKEIKMVKEVGNIIRYHHERFDGTGYPRGMKKDAIPLEARIFALADALDAITSPRPYRRERDFQTAKKEIQENSGTHFDPLIVDAFCSLRLEKWERVRFETTKILPAVEDFQKLASRQK